MRYSTRAPRTIYRSRTGVLFGVCKGLAEHFDLSVFWIRLGVIVTFFFSGLWPVFLVYMAAAFMLKPAPIRPIESEDEEEFYDSYVRSPQNAAQRLRRKFENLERRIRRMEDKITDRSYEWERKFRSR